MDDKARLQDYLARNGGKLPPMPDGPYLERFSAREMAQALESEINRARGVGHTKITIDMNFDDAADLASFLRRAELLGA